MIEGSLISLVGLLLAVAAAVGTIWWRLSVKISANTAGLHRKVEENVARMQDRINQTRDEYARRDDLAGHMDRLENGQDRIITAMERLNRRIDGLVMPWQKPDGERPAG